MASALPRNTSNEIIERLNGEINAALADPNVRARLSDLGGMPRLLSPADFGKLIADETEVGQGDPGGQHQAGVTLYAPPIFLTSDVRMR